MRLLIGCILAGLCLTSCSNSSEVRGNRYFDTRAYFSSEIGRLTQHKQSLYKILSYKNTSDSIELQNVNWVDELAAFSEIDLSKPAYSGNFSVDSVVEGNHLLVNYHSAGNSDIKSVSLVFDGSDSQPEQVIIELSEYNLLYSYEKRLGYFKDSAYRISGTQSVLFFPGSGYVITGAINSAGRSPQP